ncbi:hypothetical protein LINGRAHAP2_LOCUS19196 [Linum grandiflorum]
MFAWRLTCLSCYC